MESSLGLSDGSADSAGKIELLPVLWVHFRYLFLWEGSPEHDSIGVCRMEWLFCEIAIFQQKLGNR